MKRLPEPPLEPPPSYWDEPEEDSAPESWLDRFLKERKEKKAMKVIDQGEYVRERIQYIFNRTFGGCDCLNKKVMEHVKCINCPVYSCFYEYLRMTGDMNENILLPIPGDFLRKENS